jgi:hypothetical protein
MQINYIMCFCLYYYGIYLALFRFQHRTFKDSIDILYYNVDSSVALQLLIECRKKTLSIVFCSATSFFVTSDKIRLWQALY